MRQDDGISRIVGWLERSYSPPYKFNLLLTYKCNLSCKFCSDSEIRASRNFRPPDELSDDEWLNLTRQGLEIGVVEWWVPGAGEPFTRSGLLLDIFRTVKKKNPAAFCKVTTNGSLLDEEIVRELVNIGVDRISISLESPRAEVHDYLRGREGTFERVSRALSKIKYWKKAIDSGKPKVNFNTVLTSKNCEDIGLFEEFAFENGVESVSVNPLRIDEYNCRQVERYGLRLTPSQKLKFTQRSKHFRPRGRVPTFLNGFKELEMGIVAESAEGFKRSRKAGKENVSFRDLFLDSSCFEPWLTMGIGFNGAVTYCTSCGTWDRSENVRNRAVEEIWKGGSFKYARDCMLRHEALKACYGCGVMTVRKEVRKKLEKLTSLNS